MTLIAAWRVSGGIVFHVDSQETVTMEDGTEYRKTVQKIEPEKMGKFDVAIAGAGNPDLILSFIEKIRRRFSAEQSEALQDFVNIFESELASFCANDVALSPDDDKDFRFIVGAVSKSTGEYDAWVTHNVTLCRISATEPELIGWSETLYKKVANSFYRPDSTIPQVVLAGVYLMTLAEATSNYVRNPFKIAVIRENGIWIEPADYVNEMSARLVDYEQRVNQIFLACADNSVKVADLEKMIDEFKQVASALHRSHIDKAVGGLTMEKLFNTNDPYPKYPRGAVIRFGVTGFSIEHDEEVNKKRRKWIASMIAKLPEHPFDLACHNCGAEFEYQIAAPTGPGKRANFRCPECGTANQTIAEPTRFRKIGDASWTETTQPRASDSSEPKR